MWLPGLCQLCIQSLLDYIKKGLGAHHNPGVILVYSHDYELSHVQIYVWVNYNDLTATSLESWLARGIIPKWPYFRLVKYYNLPRYIYIYTYILCQK